MYLLTILPAIMKDSGAAKHEFAKPTIGSTLSYLHRQPIDHSTFQKPS